MTLHPFPKSTPHWLTSNFAAYYGSFDYLAYGANSIHNYIELKYISIGTSLLVWRLRDHLPIQETWVWSLVLEVRSHMPWGNWACMQQPRPSIAKNYKIKYLSISMRAKSLQLYPTLCNLMEDSPPGFSIHGILQARILEWVAVPFSRGSSRPGDRTWVCNVSCIWQVGSLPLVPPGKPYWSTYPPK